ncbi:MAG: hypothetical protein OEV92_04770 [Nitrospinota bacterium]|nr:hypothetical protein [Nitrospinota bacterium]
MRGSTHIVTLIAMAVIFISGGCAGGSSGSSKGGTDVPAGSLTVTVGFWSTNDCSGNTIATISFPVDYANTQCYSWPGHSGENSASNFVCGANSLSYTQWTTMTCSGGQNSSGTAKTVHTDQCQQDVPPTLYSKIIDFSGCGG